MKKKKDQDSHLKSVNVESNYSATIVQSGATGAVVPCVQNVRMPCHQIQNGFMRVKAARKRMSDIIFF